MKRKIHLLFLWAALLLISAHSCRKEKGKRLVGGFPSEFIEREDGFKKLSDYYGFRLHKVLEIDPGLMYDAVRNETVDIISGFVTDARIRQYDLIILEDDKNFFPSYLAAPLVSEALIKKHPEIATIINQLSGAISDEEMTSLNAEVDLDGKLPRQAAEGFLASKGFKTSNSAARRGQPDFLIGSKNFTESYILAEMFMILIQNYSSLNVDKRLGLGGTKIAFEALKNGEIGLYPEYTGTALLMLTSTDSRQVDDVQMRNKDAAYEYVNQLLMNDFQVKFLEPLGLSNNFAMAMKKERAEALGVSKLSDLTKLAPYQ